jgi:hypothetical protein
MNELLKFWGYIKENWDADDIEAAKESYPFDTDQLCAAHLAKMTEEEIASLFSDVIDWFMDAFGVDNYGDVAETLAELGLEDDKIDELLGGDEE